MLEFSAATLASKIASLIASAFYNSLNQFGSKVNRKQVMRKRFPLFLVVLIIAICAIAGGAMSSRFTSPLSASVTKNISVATNSSEANVSEDADTNLDGLEVDYRDAVTTVAENYVGDIDYAKANQAAIQGMLMTLDPHSSFFPTDDFRKLKEDQDSRFYGVGVTILRHRDGVYVQAPVEGTPAARAGLRFGDRIVEVDGKDAREWSSAEVSKNVRGALGTNVTLKLERAGESAPVYRTIMRDAVTSPSIRAAYMAQPGTGYIGLTGGFTHTTEAELKLALASLQKQGARQIVLDLRNNPGGLLDQAIAVAGQFLPRDAVVVTVRGREPQDRRVYKNTEDETQQFPLVVLINRNSASASEIVAGAIQDYGRGLIVGETSFGKGLVQRVFQLPFGNGLTLTTAKYYTPFGRLIQREYAAGSFYDYYVRHNLDAATTNNTGAPTNPASRTLRSNPNLPNAAAPIMTPAPTPQPTPTGTPVRTAGGRVFYGGGGITPDMEVKPLDLSGSTRGRIYEAAFFFVRELAAGKINGLEQYRVSNNQTNPPATINANGRGFAYPVNDAVLAAFRDYVRRDQTLQLNSKQIDADLDFARLRIEDELTTAAFGSDAANRVILGNDPQLLRAIELFPEAKRLAETVRGNMSTT